MVIEFKKPGVTSETVTLIKPSGGFGDTAAHQFRDLAGQTEFENHLLPGDRFLILVAAMRGHSATVALMKNFYTRQRGGFIGFSFFRN